MKDNEVSVVSDVVPLDPFANGRRADDLPTHTRIAPFFHERTKRAVKGFAVKSHAAYHTLGL